MEEIIKNNLEVVYKEFKDYEAYFKGIAPKIKEAREKFSEFAMQNYDDTDVLMKNYLENDVTPELHKADLITLQNKLIYTYEAVRDAIEIPAEIKNEIESFIKPKQVYIIQAGEAKEIDPEHTAKIKSAAKEYYKPIVEQLQKQYGTK